MLDVGIYSNDRRLRNSSLNHLVDEFFHVEFLNATNAVRLDPSKQTEAELKSLLTEVAPDVYQFRIFKDWFISALSSELNFLGSSGIPARRPNGMNR